MIHQHFDGDEIITTTLGECLNCGEPTNTSYCSEDCFCDGEGKTICDAGHVHDEGTDCPECEEIEMRSSSVRYVVRYYDREWSRRGKGGVRSRSFDDRLEAERFASENQLYAGPCKVEEIEIKEASA
jgi:hypothetical protein